MARYTVIYDACVLYPAPLRDLLIQLATANLFRAKWTDKIHDEWIENLLATRTDIDRAALARTRHLMNTAVPNCLVTGYEYLIPVLNLPDQDDHHVLAAAIHSRADAIVTFNLRDFPEGDLKAHNVEAIHPDDFIALQFDLDNAGVIVSASKCRHRLNNPSLTPRTYLDTLLAQELPKTVAALTPYITLL